jgi:Subtilase family
MKFTKIVSALMAAGVIAGSAQAEPLNLTPYNTAEYTANTISPGKTDDDFLRAINANAAWARGYTGRGVLALVLDTGINANHPEFIGRIAYNRDFINSKNGTNDVAGHGSNIAGLIAANWDGVGMAGVAPNAQLAIAKISDGVGVNLTQGRAAMTWADGLGAVVANLSANTAYTDAYLKNFTKLTDGSYYNTDSRYIGRYYGGESPDLWAKALGKDMILVNSAGNSGLAYPELPGTLAKAVDAQGNLVLGGRVIIVGAWNLQTNSMAAYSNRAGNICLNISNGACADKYRISDFYILAPGNDFGPAKSGNGYTLFTGTSQAAGVVTGSVAVISQMWPNMRGENIVKLLMVTANKDLPNYNVNVMGQGLLDLEKATRPYGATGIPTTGRTKSAVSGAVTSAGLNSINSKLSSIMVTDSFDRDFYVDLSRSTQKPLDTFNPVARLDFYQDYNPFNRLNAFTFSRQAVAGDTTVKLSANDQLGTAMLSMATNWLSDQQYIVGITGGVLNERGAWAGNNIGGSLGTVDNSYTTFIGANARYRLNNNNSVFANAYLGMTQAGLNSGLVTNIGTTQSYSWSLGLDHTQDQHTVGAMVSQPVTVYNGQIELTLPQGYDANGKIRWERSAVSAVSAAQEYDLGVYYKFKSDNIRVTMYAEHQINYLNQAGANRNVLGLGFSAEF